MAQSSLRNRMYRPMPRVQQRPRVTATGKQTSSGDVFSAEGGGSTAQQFSRIRDAQQGGSRLGAFTRFKTQGMDPNVQPDAFDEEGAGQEAGYRRLQPGEDIDLTGGTVQGSRQVPTATARGGLQPQRQSGFQRVSPGLYRSPDGKIVRESQMKAAQRPTATARPDNQNLIGRVTPEQAAQLGNGSGGQTFTPAKRPAMATAKPTPKPRPAFRKVR